MSFKIHIDEVTASTKLSRVVEDILRVVNPENLVFMCIGTDRSTGDSYGPLVGTFIKEIELEHGHMKVYGTLDEPVHAKNLEDYIKRTRVINNKFVIAIDASLGKEENIGKIYTRESPLYPGSGVGKNLTPVGDMSITGIVNFSGFMEYTVLQNTRLSLVYKMAQTTAEAIKMALNNYSNSYIEEAAVSL